MAKIAKAARLAVCSYPGTLEVFGSVRCYKLTAGAVVDLDEVVGFRGHGRAAVPETLEASLGEYLAFFTAPASPAATTTRQAPPARADHE